MLGDLARPETLATALEGVDAIVFTHGSDVSSEAAAREVDYGAVRNVLGVLLGRSARIALMTSIGVTKRAGADNRSTRIHDWKRRGERLVRASGLPYTIVRPGWFDYNKPDQHHLVFLRGDRRHAGDSSDGVVARQQIADVLVHSLSSDAARGKTLELVAERGAAPASLEPLFAALQPDAAGGPDAARDLDNIPMAEEPADVRQDLERLARAIPVPSN